MKNILYETILEPISVIFCAGSHHLGRRFQDETAHQGVCQRGNASAAAAASFASSVESRCHFLHRSARQTTLSCLETECVLEQFHPESCKQRKCMRAELASFGQNMVTFASTQVVNH